MSQVSLYSAFLQVPLMEGSSKSPLDEDKDWSGHVWKWSSEELSLLTDFWSLLRCFSLIIPLGGRSRPPCGLFNKLLWRKVFPVLSGANGVINCGNVFLSSSFGITVHSSVLKCTSVSFPSARPASENTWLFDWEGHVWRATSEPWRRSSPLTQSVKFLSLVYAEILWEVKLLWRSSSKTNPSWETLSPVTSTSAFPSDWNTET